MKIFLTGASGFVGSSVAVRLMQEGHGVRGLVRDPAKAAAVRGLGVEPVLGTLDDGDLLTREARAADAVVNAADSDHRPAVEALVAGLAGSHKPLLHTSGTSIVGDQAMGEPSERVFDEDSDIVPEPDKAARVALDRLVLGAEGVRSVVLCNSLIYGHSLGLKAAQSVQLPRLVARARRTGQAAYIGRGLNRWSTVHIGDVADLYVQALEKAEAGLFCFVENGEAAFRDMVAAIAEALGLGAPVSLSAAEAVAEWGRRQAVFSLGSNSRVRGRRARERFGWLPRHGSAVAWIRQHLVETDAPDAAGFAA